MAQETVSPTDRIGTREEWRAARLALLDAEKELTRRSDEVAERRGQLPWVPVEKDYRFDTELGEASLMDLFRGQSQLLVYHFMFPPSWSEGCASCSSLTDGWNGIWLHLEHHDVAMTAVSRAPIEKLLAYKQRMGWTIPWASSYRNDFNVDVGVSFRESDLAAGRADYNCRPLTVELDRLPHQGESSEPVDDVEGPGVSAFARVGDDVCHTYSTYARGGDVLWAMYQWLDRAPLGRNEHGMWWRRNDEYGPAPTTGHDAGAES
jgi:predicted dithiol-disulfide oxidoreductase (DUF899 family)